MTTLTAARGDTFTDTAGRQPGSDTRPAPRPRQRNAAVPAPADRIAKRRAAALALDPVVRAQLARLSPWPLAAPPSLTLYDTIWPATPEAGACWTLAAGLFGPLTHGVWSYAVTLCFDTEDRPRQFIVSGATTATSEGVSETALATAIASVRRGGPLRTDSPNVLPFVL